MVQTQPNQLLDRYLQAVYYLLPNRNQADIIRELRENLLSEIEDREEDLGRPLSGAELTEVLRRHGHPVLVAGRYGHSRALIGPVFLPLYWLTLKLGLGVAGVVTLVLALVQMALGGEPWGQLGEALLAYPGRALQVFAWSTISFALLDYIYARARQERIWDPEALPPLAAPENLGSRTNSFLEALFTGAALAWLLALPRNAWLALGPAAAFLEPAPVWSATYPYVLLLTVGAGVLAVANTIRPQWTPARSIARLALVTGAFALYGYWLQAGPWFAARSGTTLPNGDTVTGFVAMVNSICSVSIAVALLLTLIELIREALRWRTRQRPRVHVNSTPASLL